MKEITENWMQRALDKFDEDRFSDGDVISHEWIKYALDIPIPRNLKEAEKIQWLTLSRVEAFKDWLLVERSIALKAFRGKGYWIVPPSDQAEVAAREAMRLVQKGISKGVKLMEHTRMDALDDDQKRRHTDAQVRLSGIGSMMGRQRRDVFALFAPGGEQ